MEFHEPKDDYSDRPPPVPRPPTYQCQKCDKFFLSKDELAVHQFDGHATSRPVLMLKGRECGRSRLAVIAQTSPADWEFFNTKAIRVNGKRCSEADARRKLSERAAGVMAVTLEGEGTGQDFEFAFQIANAADLDGVDDRLYELIRGQKLGIHAVDTFITSSDAFQTARYYRDGLASYLYGVLARERSPESGLVALPNATDAYKERYAEAVEQLGKFDRPAAEAVCGLVALHYNQFDLAMRKTRSPRVARVARRFMTLLKAVRDESIIAPVGNEKSLDYFLSDAETERILSWCSIPLDGTAAGAVADMEGALADVEPEDALKLRIIAAEHHLAAGRPELGLGHVASLRHTHELEAWSSWFEDRAGIMSP